MISNTNSARHSSHHTPLKVVKEEGMRERKECFSLCHSCVLWTWKISHFFKHFKLFLLFMYLECSRMTPSQHSLNLGSSKGGWLLEKEGESAKTSPKVCHAPSDPDTLRFLSCRLSCPVFSWWLLCSWPLGLPLCLSEKFLAGDRCLWNFCEIVFNFLNAYRIRKLLLKSHPKGKYIQAVCLQIIFSCMSENTWKHIFNCKD